MCLIFGPERRLHEADLGFHLVIDRRNDKWNSVKTVLLKISVSRFLSINSLNMQKAPLYSLIYNNNDTIILIITNVCVLAKAFFPGLVHVAYVLRPAGFLQKAISEVSNKLFREDFKFRVIVLASLAELHDFVDKDQLTEQLGGDLPYCHHTWIQNRIVMPHHVKINHLGVFVALHHTDSLTIAIFVLYFFFFFFRLFFVFTL